MIAHDVLDYLTERGITVSYRGNPSAEILGISSLTRNQFRSICWIKNESYLSDALAAQLKENETVVVSPFEISGVNCLLTDYPKGVYSEILSHFFYERKPHTIAETATVLTSKIGKNVHIGAHCYIGEEVSIGDDTVIHPNVSIICPCTIGAGCILYPGVVIGADGFGYYFDDQGLPVKVDHFSGVRIGDRVEIGANTCVDRGTLDDTCIGNDVKIDNLVHIAHNAEIGNGAVIIAGAIVCGSVTIGERGYLAPGAIVKNQLTVGSGALVGMGAVVTRAVGENMVAAGIPAKELRAVRKGDK